MRFFLAYCWLQMAGTSHSVETTYQQNPTVHSKSKFPWTCKQINFNILFTKDHEYGVRHKFAVLLD